MHSLQFFPTSITVIQLLFFDLLRMREFALVIQPNKKVLAFSRKSKLQDCSWAFRQQLEEWKIYIY